MPFKEETTMSKKLVAFFSASGVTKNVSERLAQIYLKSNRRFPTAGPTWTGQIKKAAALWR